jgi:Flp pilus assembly protein TadG
LQAISIGGNAYTLVETDSREQESTVFKKLRGRKLGASEEGSEILEFALVATVLCTLLFGIIDFSKAMYTYHWVSYAATQGTRYASTRGNGNTSNCATFSSSGCIASAAQIGSYVKSLAVGTYVSSLITSGSVGLADFNLTVLTTWPGVSAGEPKNCSVASGTNSPGCPVNVSVTYIYRFTLPFIKSQLSTIRMTSTSQVVISN